MLFHKCRFWLHCCSNLLSSVCCLPGHIPHVFWIKSRDLILVRLAGGGRSAALARGHTMPLRNMPPLDHRRQMLRFLHRPGCARVSQSAQFAMIWRVVQSLRPYVGVCSALLFCFAFSTAVDFPLCHRWCPRRPALLNCFPQTTLPLGFAGWSSKA